MIRLREGDFAYDQDELDVMKQDIIPGDLSLVESIQPIQPAPLIDKPAFDGLDLLHYHALFTSKSSFSFIIWPFRLLLKLNKLLRM
jgi:hypothetical protein